MESPGRHLERDGLRQVPHRHVVLLVEDYDDLREGIVMYLDLVGFEARGACSGATALKMLSEGYRPCVVLLDVWMPDMDGWEVSSALQARPDTADIPIVMVSGDTDVVLGHDHGIAAFLSKPCLPEDVVSAVTTHARCAH